LSVSNKIVITSSRLDIPGGIEKAVTSLASLLAEKGHDVTILILYKTANSFYPVHPAVTVVQFPLYFGIGIKGNMISRKAAFLSDIKQLKKWLAAEKPSCIITTEYSHAAATILTGAKKSSNVYFWQHHEHSWLQQSTFWNLLLKYTYPRLTGVICLNETEAAYYKKMATPIVIPNFSENNTGKKSTVTNKSILSVGWLIPRKGIDFIMTAANIIFQKHPDWQWKIIGDGQLKEELLSFIRQEKLENNLLLQNPVSADLSDEYSNASIFVLASRLEVFGLVLTEAMGYGVPCVSFDCASGPVNIITRHEDGVLVERENPIRLAEAIITLIENETLRKKMGEKAIANVQRFSPERIYELWKPLLTSPSGRNSVF
jgi:glycosyltransferase involved in cell wall biosynthesis